MKGPPCLNPSCKNHGRSHPNCRCYSGGMAEGGEVTNHFCSEDRLHHSECEYFLDGGEVIPADKVVLDGPSNREEIPPDQVKLDKKEEIPSDQVILDKDKYGSTGQQIITGIEGAAQGIAGPLATLAETKLLGVKPEDITGRTKENPWIHGTTEAGGIASSFFLPGGQGKLIALGTKAFTANKYLRLALEGISFAGSDEITKALLHQPGVGPEETAASAAIHMATNGLLFAGSGPLFGLAGKALDQIGGQKMIDLSTRALTRLASDKPFNKLMEGAAAYYAQKYGLPEGAETITKVLSGAGTYGALRKLVEPYVEDIVGKPLSKANKYVADAILSALKEENLLSIPTAARWGKYVSQGVKSYLPHIESMFKGSYTELVPEAHKQLKDILREDVEEGKLQKKIEESYQNNSTQPQAYAKGGQVQAHGAEPDSFSQLYPEQNIILNQMKGRIYGYLNSIRPLPNQNKLPFDETPKQTEQKKSYERALSFAVNPLQILNYVNKGNLTPSDLKHFTSLHPEIYRLLTKKMTEGVIKAQLNGEKPPYRKRQAMSLFLGANLDSSTTPQAIQTAQSVFNAQKARQTQMQQPTKNKRGTSTLGKSSQSYLTDNQAREMRQQRLKA